MEATDITDATCEKIVLMLLAAPGMTAPAAAATKPAINAYSIRSWPLVSRRTRIFKIKLLIFIFSLLCSGLRAQRVCLASYK